MHSYAVWDPINHDEHKDAASILAPGPAQAAVYYAMSDAEGLRDGLYTHEGRALDSLLQGHPLHVRDARGVVLAYLVGATELTPLRLGALRTGLFRPARKEAP